MKRIYRVLLLLTLCSFGFTSKAAQLNFSGFQSSSVISALPGTSFSVAQNDYALLPAVSGYVNYSVKNNLMVFIDHTYSTYIGTAYSYTVRLELKTWNSATTLTTQTIDLPVEYDPNANPGVSYKDRSVFNFTGAHKVEVKVLDIKDNNTGLWGVTNPQDNFIIKTNIDIERIYDFNAASTATTSKTPYNLNANAGDDELVISWAGISGAEEYDLEWTYIDDYDVSNVSTPKALSALNWDFRNNATRITTSQTSYTLSLIYERGYVVFRVRGIGHNQTTPSIQIFGNWNIADNGVMSTLSTNSYYRTTGHNGTLNWQYQSVFAEEGKKKEVVGYYDGSLRGRQTVTKTNSDNTAVAGESLYDQVGRKAIDILPVPLQSPAIDYYPNLNVNMAGNKYGWSDFDTDAASCSTSTSGMKNTSGASQYYSPNNPDKTGNNAYIPDAQNYPFSQVEYQPDNTGRIRRQGGVGPDHQLNSGHETKYYYGQPTQIELDRLFGNEVGYASHYKKNMVVDPNGQISISYLDQEGRVIATALSGQKPTNMSQLSSYPSSPTTLNADLIPAINGKSVSKQNSISLDYTSLEYNSQILVSEPGNYTFNYNVAQETFTYTNGVCSICFDCTYDLEITITDECGTVIYTDKANIGSPSPDLTCNNVAVYHSAGKTFPFTVSLGVGKYQVIKSLKINQDAYEFYLSKYLDGTVNTCLTPFSQFLTEEKAKLDYTGCELTCDQCVASLGTRDEYVLAGKGTEAEWQAEYDKCMEPCEGTSLCEQTLHMMTEDMKPGGQYAQWYDPAKETMDVSIYPLSIFNPANFLPDLNKAYTDPDAAYWKNPKVETRDAAGTFNVVSGYFEEDGVTRSVIEAVKLLDGSWFPKADAYFAVGDKNYCYPEKLQNVRDFISFYKSSWAKSLVYYHPEYCYNKWCIINISSSFKPYEKNSEDFDAALDDINTYAAAAAAGYTSNVNNIANVDPFFNSAPNGTGYKTTMTTKLGDWDGTGRNAMIVSTIAARAPRWYGTNYPVGYDVWGSGSTTEQDKAWNTFKSFYLSYKQELMKNSADAWVTNSSNCARGYNGCIGEANFNPFPAMTFSILNGNTDPCAMQTYLYYKNKTRRFDINSALAKATVDEEKARFNRSFYEGACPADLDLMATMNSMITAGRLCSTHAMQDDDGFSFELYKTLMGTSSPPSTYSAWNWAPVTCGNNKLQVFMSSGTNAVSCPSIGGAALEMTMTPGFVWSNVTALSDYKFIKYDVASGMRTFQCSATIAGTKYLVEGRTCIALGNCTFGDDCRNTDYAISLQALLSSLAQNAVLTSGTAVDIETNYTTFVNRHIRSNVGGTNNNLRYVYAGGTPAVLRIYQNLMGPSANDINITFNSYVPATFTNANLPSLRYFTDWKYIDTDVKKTFTVKGWYLSGSTWVSVLITGSVNRGTLAWCNEPVPGVCDNTEYRATLDFEAFLKDVIVTHPVSDVDLKSNFKYTGLMESYVGKGNATLVAPSYNNHSITTSIKLTDPSSGTVISNCAITLERKYQDIIAQNDPTKWFSNIIDFGLLRADMKTYQSGGAHFFTAVVRFSSGATEEVRGSVSCIPLYRCDKCETEGLFYKTENDDTCDEYRFYKEQVELFNIQYMGGDAPLTPYSDTFPCGCVSNYLTYLKLLQMNVNLQYTPLVYPIQGVVWSLQQFKNNGCVLKKTGECCIAQGGSFYTPDPRTQTLQSIVGLINSTYNTPNPPSWWTGPFTLDPNHFECDQTLTCNCIAKYIEYLSRWVNYNNIYSPWPGPPPFMPKTYDVFKKTCDGGDCWWQYNYYYNVYSSRGGTPEAYNKNVACDCYMHAAKHMSTDSTKMPLLQYCKKISTFVSYNPYKNINFTLGLPIGKLDNTARIYATRQFSHCTPEVYPTSDYVNGCSEWLDKIAYGNAEIRYREYIRKTTEDFHKAYMNKCMGALETFTMQYPIRDYHYTLYFYDQAGSLVRTVPPAGVKIISDPTVLSDIQSDRFTGQRRVYTTHILNTVYEYNSLNQLVKQSVPDHDKMDKWYVNSTSGIPSGFVATDIHFSDVNLGYMIGNINVSGANGDAMILRSEDGGKNWNRVGDIRTADIVKSAMANSTIGYAIGKGGLFLKTSDGGANWKIVPTNNAFNNDLNDLVVRVNGPNYEGVVGGNGGFSSYFIDNGTSIVWSSKTLPGAYTSYNVISISFKETTTGVGYAIIDLAGISKVLSCATFTGPWTEVVMNTRTRAADLACIYLYSSTAGFAGGVDGTLLKTTDAGVTWTMVPTAKTYTFTKLYFYSATVGMGLANDGKLYSTTDGGLTWTQSSALGTYRDFSFYNTSTGAGYGVGNSGLFSRLTVNATTIKVEKVKYPQNITGNFTTVAALVSGTDGVVAGESGLIYRMVTATTNLTFYDITAAAVSGKNFTKSFVNTTTVGALITSDGKLWRLNIAGAAPSFTGTYTDISGGVSTFVDFSKASTSLLCLSNGVGTTAVRGYSATSPATPTFTYTPTAQTGDGTMKALHAIGSTSVLVVGNNGTIYKYAGAWSYPSTAVTPHTLTTVFAYPAMANVIIGGKDGLILNSANNATDFTTVPTATVNQINCIASNSPGTYWVGANNGQVLNISPSFTVTAFNGFNNYHVQSLNVTSSSSIIAITSGNNGGIYRTSNTGATWDFISSASVADLNVVWKSSIISGSEILLTGNEGQMASYNHTTGVWTRKNKYTHILNDVYLNKYGEGMAVGNDGVSLKTTNRGYTWYYNGQLAKTGSTYVNLNKVFVETGGQASVVGASAFAKTMNTNTTSATDITLPGISGSVNLMGLTLNDKGTFLIAGGNVVYSKLSGAPAWSLVHTGGGGEVFNDIESEGDYALLVGNSKLVKRCTTINTPTPVFITVTVPGTVPASDFKDVEMYDMSRAYIAGTAGVVLKTVDWGAGWIQKFSDVNSTNTSTNLNAIAINKRDHLVFAGASNYGREVTDQADFTTSQFWYDRLGRMILSQNTKQFNKATKAYSYTLFDALGRMTQVGEKANNGLVETTYSGKQIDDALFTTWLNSGANNTRTEVTFTYYDVQFGGISTSIIIQINLRKRVASMSYEDVYDANDNTYQQATHFSYDIHGNINHLVQDIPALNSISQQYKHIYYNYDFISGKMNQFDFNPGGLDEYHHKYTYDADNRVTEVYTSKDGLVWDKDATYQYYKHGSLTRTEIGDLKVQGQDYFYTIQGWIKGINSNSMNETRDPGRDGDLSLGGNTHAAVARDAYGYSLGYYEGDFSPIGTFTTAQKAVAQTSGSDMMSARNDLWNGNISSMVTCLPKASDYSSSKTITAEAYGNAYQYDQLNRLASSRTFTNLNYSTNVWQNGGGTNPQSYATDYTYDAMGNILTQKRNGAGIAGLPQALDDLTYNYQTNSNGLVSNRLYLVDDNVSNTNYTDDIDDQGTFNNTPGTINTTNNYGYDELGNLVRDDKEEIANIEWTVYGKIKKVTRTGVSTKPDLEFGYDAMGSRLWKKVKPKPLNSATEKVYYYVRNSQGNCMARYSQYMHNTNGLTYEVQEHNLYGRGRVGVDNTLKTLYTSGALVTVNTSYNYRLLGIKSYELSNHLGNVLVTISDKKVYKTSGGNIYFETEMTTISDYTPFGSAMLSRSYSSGNYRFGFNSQEKDPELGDAYVFEYRTHDARLGRFLSVDPLKLKFPYYSTYSFAGNKPIAAIDIEGAEDKIVIKSGAPTGSECTFTAGAATVLYEIFEARLNSANFNNTGADDIITYEAEKDFWGNETGKNLAKNNISNFAPPGTDISKLSGSDALKLYANYVADALTKDPDKNLLSFTGELDEINDDPFKLSVSVTQIKYSKLIKTETRTVTETVSEESYASSESAVEYLKSIGVDVSAKTIAGISESGITLSSNSSNKSATIIKKDGKITVTTSQTVEKTFYTYKAQVTVFVKATVQQDGETSAGTGTESEHKDLDCEITTTTKIE